MTLKERREATGLSVQEAAKVLGFPVKTWENWENGEKSPAPFIEKQIIDKLDKIKK
ncbi:MAG: helix-turn-helix domain-containing protein [Lachnospiraceae bacterium]|nr:helix-turn-helix domain-containing protein [Lachnospiraceae bacterium]